MKIEIREDILNPATLKPNTYRIGRLDTKAACRHGHGHPMFSTHRCPYYQAKADADYPKGWCRTNDVYCDVFYDVEIPD